MRHRTLPHTRVSRRPRDAQEHPCGNAPGGAQVDPGWAAACTVWLSPGPPYPVGVRGWAHPNGDRRTPLLLARQCVPDWVRLSRGEPGPGARRPGAARSPRAHPRAVPTLRRSLVALLKAPPRAYGWCRTRWSCAPLALTLQRQRGIAVSAETMRRWVHEVGWVWQQANRVATDDDPHRVDRRARMRFVYEHLRLWEALVCADELAIQLLPKVGSAWMPKGTQAEVMTPGTNEKPSLAGALELATGTLHHALGPRNTNELFRQLLPRLDHVYPAPHSTRVSVVVDHNNIQQAKAVEHWLAEPPRVALLFLPTDGPWANPIERAFGDVHDGCPRDHRRKRLWDLVADVVEPLQVNGPWPYTLSDIYDEPAVTEAGTNMGIEQTLATAG